MNRAPFKAAALLLVALGSPASGQSVYKCTGPDGSVSFQDRPCGDSAEQQTMRAETPVPSAPAGFTGKVVPVPGGVEAAIMVFDYVDASVREDGERGTTITLRTKPGEPRMHMMLTIVPNKRGKMPPRETREDAVKRIATQRAGHGFDGYEMIEFEARSGAGIVSVLDNRRQTWGAASDNHYPVLTAGLIANDRHIVALTILTDGDDDKVLSDAITVAKTLSIAPEIIATDAGSGRLVLPEPPAGYSWARAPRIKGALLKPDGWYFKAQQDGDDLAYFISRERYTEPVGYDAGFSLNVQTKVPEKTGMSPATYAEAFIRTAQGELETLEAPFSKRRGPYVSHGALFGATDPDKGDFNALMFAIANEATGTVYFCIFEGPDDEWEALRPIGDAILQRLLINDGI